MKRCILYTAVAVLAISIMIPGCANIKEYFGAKTATTQKAGPHPCYLDFKDVLVPGELKKSESESFITDANGILVLSGRVDKDSLAEFFKTSMTSDGWIFQHEYGFKSSIKLFFSKPGKISSFLISENPLGTTVEIWVTKQKVR
ncbi:MAG: hypothetical protein U9P49_00115 [Thermodesulfobacteriota bacterium]|nr:hypothetical protein [Thermodesulfobacteriota bacterium]